MAQGTALNHSTIERIEQFWAAHFGCSPSAFQAAGLKVLPWEQPGRLWVFRYGESCI
jgi:hypothetical protein